MPSHHRNAVVRMDKYKKDRTRDSFDQTPYLFKEKNMCMAAADPRNDTHQPIRCPRSRAHNRWARTHAGRIFGSESMETQQIILRHRREGRALSALRGERAQLAASQNLTEEDVQILSRDSSSAVRQTLAANPEAMKIAPEIMKEMEAREKHPTVLQAFRGEVGFHEISSAARTWKRKGAKGKGKYPESTEDFTDEQPRGGSYDPANPVEAPRVVTGLKAAAKPQYDAMMAEVGPAEQWTRPHRQVTLSTLSRTPAVFEHLQASQHVSLWSEYSPRIRAGVLRAFGSSSPRLLKHAYLTGDRQTQVFVMKELADAHALCFMLYSADENLQKVAALRLHVTGHIAEDAFTGDWEVAKTQAIAFSKTLTAKK